MVGVALKLAMRSEVQKLNSQVEVLGEKNEELQDKLDISS